MTKQQFRVAYRDFRRSIKATSKYGRTVPLRCGEVRFIAEYVGTALHSVHCQRYREE
jgi:hypothetical protein